MNYHSEKNRTKHDEDESELNIYTIENLLSFTSHINDISSENKSIQRSIALLRQDIKKIVREEVEGALQRN